jgi:hypothetical protein
MPNRGSQQAETQVRGYIRDVPGRTPQGGGERQLQQQRRGSGTIRNVRQQNPVEEIYENMSNAVEGMDEEDIDIREPRPNGVTPDVPITRNGFPDRRFLGARHLPPPEVQDQENRRARVGGEIDGVHITLTGKPDRRFKENRALSDDEVNQQWVQMLNRRYLQH